MSHATNMMIQWIGVGLVVCASVGWIVWKKTRPQCPRTDEEDGEDVTPLCNGCTLYDACKVKKKQK